MILCESWHGEQEEKFSAIKIPWFIRQPTYQTREAAGVIGVTGGQDGEKGR